VIVTSCGCDSRRPAPVMRTKRACFIALDRLGAAVAHRLAEPADDLMQHIGERAFVGDAALDPLSDELLYVLDVALEVAVLREARAFIAPIEPMPRTP